MPPAKPTSWLLLRCAGPGVAGAIGVAMIYLRKRKSASAALEAVLDVGVDEFRETVQNAADKGRRDDRG